MADLPPRIIVHLSTDVPYREAAEEALDDPAASEWNALSEAHPDLGLSLNPLLRTKTAEDTRALMGRAAERSEEPVPNLLRIMAVDVRGAFDPGTLVRAVQALPFVELAYLESPTTQPVNPVDDPLAFLQTHLLPAPFGVGALGAWNLAGADGAGVRYVDIEYGWNLNHEDLAGANVAQLNASVPGNDEHSTACLGIVLAQDNTSGVIGLAPRVTAAITSALSVPLPDALTTAATFLNAGDVLLIEVQAAGNLPVEIDPHVALLLRTLMIAGIVVIEPAGNGSVDLDTIIRPDGTGFMRGFFNFFDTGAIMVGAREALNRRRSSFSNFGSRVDCHAIGESIVTTSAQFGQPYIGIVPGSGFGGTSGASAIVAGAAVVMAGIARARGTTLTPDRMRGLLSAPAFNTTTDNPSADRIGTMPDLERAAQQI